MASHLGSRYRLCHDDHFFWLTPFDAARHAPHARLATYAIDRLNELIPGLRIAPPDGGWPAILLDDLDTHLLYESRFGGTGAQIISGGSYRSYPVGHLAIPVSSDEDLTAAFAHELVHAILSPRRVPVWIQEGIACEVETRLGSRPDPFTDAKELSEGISFGRSMEPAVFWSGHAFAHPESSRHAYLIAQIIARRWTRDAALMASLCRISPEEWADQDGAIGLDRDLLLRSIVSPVRQGSWLARMLHAVFVTE